jgi:hypothetical protein
MQFYKTDRGCGWFTAALFVAAIMVGWSLPAYAEPPGVDIMIRAQNRSTDDTPFCGTGAGLIGDRLDVDAFMDPVGNVTGTARFEDANGNVTFINVDSFFAFALGVPFGGGVLLQDLVNDGTVPTLDVVAIWMDSLSSKPNMVNVELPRGCANTVSTFTPGVDKVTVQIKFR